MQCYRSFQFEILAEIFLQNYHLWYIVNAFYQVNVLLVPLIVFLYYWLLY